MLVDSHTHLNFPELFDNIDMYLDLMKVNNVDYALCVATNPSNWAKTLEVASKSPNIFASVGVHPTEDLLGLDLTTDMLLQYTSHPKVIAIGETGLDYCKQNAEHLKHQRDRFELHIAVAKQVDLPLIIHTREAIDDTLKIMQQHNVEKAVMHCFTEDWQSAKRCLDMGFYISISGIVTFKNAKTVQEMARKIPLDRLLVETDAPFLAPQPYRGKLNHPALVKETAKYLADLRNMSFEDLSKCTTDNFFNLFNKAQVFRCKTEG